MKKIRIILHEVARTLPANSVVLRPPGWNATSDEAYAWLENLDNPSVVFRGMESAEFEATIGSGRPIWSRGNFSFHCEGTCFADSAADAESYANFGSPDPRKTGLPTYLVEVEKTAIMKQDSDGYIKSPEPVPLSSIKRIWKMEDVDGAIVATLIRK